LEDVCEFSKGSDINAECSHVFGHDSSSIDARAHGLRRMVGMMTAHFGLSVAFKEQYDSSM
jgi:hypothetical protein